MMTSYFRFRHSCIIIAYIRNFVMLVGAYIQGCCEESLQGSPGGRTACPDSGYRSATEPGGRTARSDLLAHFHHGNASTV